MNTQGLGANAWWPPGQAAADEYVAYAHQFDAATCLEHFDSVVGAAKAAHFGDGAGAAFAALLGEKIHTRTPASFIRLGDADGNVLFSRLKQFPELTTYNLQKISQIYFGTPKLMSDERDFFADVVIAAIEQADVVGGPERDTIARSFQTPAADLDVRGMCGMRGVYNYLATAFDLSTLAGAVWGSTWFSRALLPHYFRLLENQPFAGFVTCYPELEAVFRERANIAETDTILVPMQASIAKVTKDIKHYPDAYPGILERLRPPYQGAVYIVAAGILSKPYCTLIKERGGIALDVGSVADIWMGKRSRPGMAGGIYDKWKIVDADAASVIARQQSM